MPEISIVIPAHNEGNNLVSTLRAIKETTPIDYEVIVVNDGSTDSCCDFLKTNSSQFKNVVLISQERKGVSISRNIGASHTHAEIIVFMDAHCKPQNGWISPILTQVNELEDGIIAPCITNMEYPVSKGYGITLTDSTFSVSWLGKKHDSPYEVPIVGGGCMVMKKSFFYKLGQFDTMKKYGVEDIEICIRCWLFGNPVTVVPNVEVSHLFKKNITFEFAWEDYVYNLLRCAVLHFEGERFIRILSTLQEKPGFSESEKNLIQSDVWEKQLLFKQRKKHDDEWFCRKFSLSI